jgi:2-succinyl-6-hydroxy-2,4-cyclohexadiene-1-carboxylate synthase
MQSVRRCAVEHPLLVGYSLGGRVALHVALREQSALGGLILEGASPGLRSRAERQERARLDRGRAEDLLTGGLPAFVESWYEGEMFASARRYPKKLNSLKRMRSRGNPAQLAQALECLGVGRQEPLWDELDQLTLPVLLVSGALDHKYRQINAEMQALLPQSRSIVISDAGHNSHWEQPQEFVNALVEFAGITKNER